MQMKSPSRESRKAQKLQQQNNPALSSPYLSGPIRPCRGVSRDGGGGRARSNPPPNNRGGRPKSKSPVLSSRRRKYSAYEDSYSVSSVGSKGYATVNRRNISKIVQNSEDKGRTILLPTEVDETLREMGRFPIQVHLPFEFYKIQNRENKNDNISIDNCDSEDDSSLESKYAEDLNDLHVHPGGSPSKKQKYILNQERKREFVKFPPVISKQESNCITNDVDMANDKLIQRKKRMKKNRKLLKAELNEMVDTMPRMKTRSKTKKGSNNLDSKKMMNSLLQPLSGSLSAKNGRSKTWI